MEPEPELEPEPEPEPEPELDPEPEPEPEPEMEPELERMKTIEVYADTRFTTLCRSCKADIEFGQNVKTGRSMPFNAPIVALRTRHDDAHRLIEIVDLSTSHFGSCPDANKWRT